MSSITLQQFPFNHFDLKNLTFLGSGSYGKVYKTINIKTNSPVAIKQINMNKIREEDLEGALDRQIKLMKELKSQNTVQLVDSYIGNKYSYMIMELCDTDLRKKMDNSPQKFKQAQCIEIFSGIMEGFKILVQNSCIHRDVKPENILIKGKKLKIGDFGFACKADMYGRDKYDQICGTPIYMAPQLLNNQPYSAKCDIWSLGLLFYELLYGASPWPLRCIESYHQAIRKRPLSFPYDVKVGKQTKDFIRKALTISEQNRIGWAEVFAHPLIKGKISGEVCLSKPVQPKIRQILSNMQEQSEKKFIDLVQVFKKYEKIQNLTQAQFSALLKQLNPTITSYQISIIFKASDKNQNGTIDKSEFQEMFCSNNFQLDPIISRQIDQFVRIAQARNIQLDELFAKFDINKTGALDSSEFKALILHLSPKFPQNKIYDLYKKLDTSGSGLIEKKEFLNFLGGGLATQKNYAGIWKEKAQRNISMLKIHLKSLNKNALQVIKMADKNLDSHLNPQQFEKLMQKIGFLITKQEVLDIFKMIDTNKSNEISMLELSEFLK